MYTVDYFISKFQAIPENQWTTHTHSDCNGRKCALGHCLDPEALAIFEAQWKANGCAFGVPSSEEWLGIQYICPGIHYINNGEDRDYPQATPKARVLAVLADIKAKELRHQQVAISDPPVYIEDIIQEEVMA